MRSSTWVGRPHGIWRFVAPAGVCSGVKPVSSPVQPSVGQRWNPNKHASPIKPFLISNVSMRLRIRYGPAKRNGTSQSQKFWLFYHERLLYDGSYTMMTQNGLGCEDGQAIFISLWLTSMQVIFKKGVSRSKWLRVGGSLPVLTHELQRGQKMIKKEILWRFIR